MTFLLPAPSQPITTRLFAAEIAGKINKATNNKINTFVFFICFSSFFIFLFSFCPKKFHPLSQNKF
ncbi:MAG: hypothetical protein A2Y98_02390 [Candidatus Portnoybacteria bacterium RBG_19FT_COMBO_36_7]|uniref:Uncharacterized protein n=1 Tax=Candidatus Portnoybacteria bacterium RBG_19FT_COMBO_36_7 TaxID=1801992 RepID=A0A1G2F7W5_9BACT|nr:MAG: hypothetical protein A2Y98_02390 [Candidatus Portnoybacteria bacterium RBG_19FT_COMBO_36_7]